MTPSPSTREGLARGVLAIILLLVPVALGAGWWMANRSSEEVTVHARMSEQGGWMPGTISASVGTPLRLRMISDDVMHGFAVGRSEAAPLDLPPGEIVETVLTFDQPGTYTYYCTRWCGPSHWRMRGVIEVDGGAAPTQQTAAPLYESLGLDIDAPHPASAVPGERPSAADGERLAVALPDGYRTREAFIIRPPADTWGALRQEPSLAGLSDDDLWDLVALQWRSTTTAEALQQGQQLFAQNCAACHGEGGAGDGVFAESVPAEAASMSGGTGPADFTDPSSMLGASSALLQGKILRGGMGTGMPYWGPIFTDEQIWSIVAYLYTFQFDYGGG